MWIARDKNGELWLHKEKPMKFRDMWCSIGDIELLSIVDKSIFPEVKWSDTEPRKFVVKPIKEEQP